MLLSWKERSQDQENSDRFGESAITSPSFRCILQSVTGSSNTPRADIWTCRSRVVKMQPNEHIKEAKWLAKWNASVLKYDKCKQYAAI